MFCFKGDTSVSLPVFRFLPIANAGSSYAVDLIANYTPSLGPLLLWVTPLECVAFNNPIAYSMKCTCFTFIASHMYFTLKPIDTKCVKAAFQTSGMWLAYDSHHLDIASGEAASS